MKQNDLLPRLQERFDSLRLRLDDPARAGAGADRDHLRSGIIELFRDTERALAELTEFREQIRHLVVRFKALPTEQTAAATPSPTRVDHLGSSTYTERGWHEIAAGDFTSAVATLRRALELAPGDAGAEVLLGWALMRSGAYDEALMRLQTVLARDPANGVARANLGYILLKKGVFGEAIEHLSRVLRTQSDRKAMLYANFYMGLLYAEREMYDDAVNFFTRALELGPNLIEAWWELGRAHFLAGRTDDASGAWARGAEGRIHSSWGVRCAGALARLAAGEQPSFG